VQYLVLYDVENRCSIAAGLHLLMHIFSDCIAVIAISKCSENYLLVYIYELSRDKEEGDIEISIITISLYLRVVNSKKNLTTRDNGSVQCRPRNSLDYNQFR